MSKPRRNASIDTYIDHFRYSIYAVEARPETRSLQALLEPGLATLRETKGRLDTLWQSTLRARAILAFFDVTLDELLVRMGKAARFDEAQDPALKLVALIFGGRTPSDLGRPTGAGFGRELDDAELIIKAFALVPEGAATVRSLLEELTTRITGGREAFSGLTTALNNLDLAKRPVEGVKSDCWNLLDRLEGQLKDRFPGQPKVVASFFLPSDISSSTIEEPEEEVSPPTPPAGGTA